MIKILTVGRNSAGGITPPCVSAIMRYDRPTFEFEHGLPAPIGLINHSWSKVITAFSHVLDSIETVYAWAPELVCDLNDTRLLENYHSLLARSAEYIEDVEVNISKCLSPKRGKQIKVAGSASSRKSITVPHNKLKHNHNRLVYVEAMTIHGRVPGVAFYHFEKGSMRPNLEIHKSRKAFSFNTELRRIFAELYFFSNKAAIAIESIDGNGATGAATSADTSTLEIVKRLEKLHHFGVLNENNNDMPIILVDTEKLTIHSGGGLLYEQADGTRVRVQFVGDGATNSFVLPSVPKKK